MPPGGQASEGSSYDDYRFGDPKSQNRLGWSSGPSKKIILSIRKDRGVVCISDRGGPIIQMARHEVLEMMEILNREFLLDTMKQV